MVEGCATGANIVVNVRENARCTSPPLPVPQDGITAFEALESGVLPPLRELLAWLEAAAAGSAARRDRPEMQAKIATEVERGTVGALVSVDSSPESKKLECEAGQDRASEAVLQVMKCWIVLELPWRVQWGFWSSTRAVGRQ